MRKTLARKKREKTRRRRIRVLLLMLLVTLLVFVMTLSAVGVVVAGAFTDLPTVDNPRLTNQPQKTKVYDSWGREVAQFYAENRESVKFNQISPWMIKAIVASEDERFYQHPGVDVKGILRALAVDIAEGEIREGGSTITQQFVKVTLGTSEKTFTRKLREAILAYRLEKKYPGKAGKDQILTMYLNTIYYGTGAYGIETASQVYFAKHAKNLTLAQAAFLAGMPQSPSSFSPYTDKKQAERRRAEVLRKMVRNRFITREAYDEAINSPLKLAYPKKPTYKIAPYYMEFVKLLLIKKFGVNRVFQGGLRVRTTINPKMQKYAEEAVSSTLDQNDDPSASLVAIDPKTGHIKAMVGGKNFERSKFNLATQGRRQPGSAFKTFVLVAALQKGISPYDQYSSSSPITIPMPGKDWRVSNAEPGTGGMMTVAQATAHSVNVVFAQMMMDVKPKNVVKVAHDMGIRSHLELVPAIALGGLGKGVTALDMASAYATLAAQGRHYPPVAITEVRDSRGKLLYRANSKGRQVITRAIASEATRLLETVIRGGTGRGANIGRPAAGKTGTSQTYRDAWFCGFTPDMAAAVWMGYPNRQTPMRSVHGRRVFGGTFPAEIWAKFMRGALDGVPATRFPFKSMGFKKSDSKANEDENSGDRQNGGNDRTPNPPAPPPEQPKPKPKPKPPSPPPPPPPDTTGTP
ncbi:MAG: penicillin-binding protein [Actinobacteria bacterium]|nr:MAG: penicillin-binding protein [Actinomycetota bacterium]